MFYIDKGAIGNGHDAGGGVAANLSESFYLFEVYIVHACAFAEDAVGGFIEVFVVADKVTKQGPLVLKFFEVTFYQQHFELIVIETKDDTVDRDAYDPVVFQLLEDRFYIFLTGGSIVRG